MKNKHIVALAIIGVVGSGIGTLALDSYLTKKEFLERCPLSKSACNCTYKATTKFFSRGAAKTYLLDLDTSEVIIESAEMSPKKQDLVTRTFNSCTRL